MFSQLSEAILLCILAASVCNLLILLSICNAIIKKAK